jgi:hypothetical protein
MQDGVQDGEDVEGAHEDEAACIVKRRRTGSEVLYVWLWEVVYVPTEFVFAPEDMYPTNDHPASSITTTSSITITTTTTTTRYKYGRNRETNKKTNEAIW